MNRRNLEARIKELEFKLEHCTIADGAGKDVWVAKFPLLMRMEKQKNTKLLVLWKQTHLKNKISN